MTIKEQQDQTIDDCFTVLLEMTNGFHNIFNILEPRPLSRYDRNDKSEFISKATAGVEEEVQEKKEAFRSLEIEKMSRVFPINLPKLIRIRTKWRDSFVQALSRSSDFTEKEREALIHYINSENYINSPNYGGVDVVALFVELSTVSNTIEKRLLRFPHSEQRKHY